MRSGRVEEFRAAFHFLEHVRFQWSGKTGVEFYHCLFQFSAQPSLCLIDDTNVGVRVGGLQSSKGGKFKFLTVEK